MKVHIKKIVVIVSFLLITGCKSNEIALSTISGGLIAGTIPEGEIYQTYYLGVIDPIQQLPPTFYRITVRGQASIFSDMKFASGWIPAEAADTISSKVGLDLNSGEIKKSGIGNNVINPRRRFILIGPEGVRENPDSHRLAIVMGASPQNFFGALDSALGSISSEVSQINDNKLATHLLAQMYLVDKLQGQLGELCAPDDTTKECP